MGDKMIEIGLIILSYLYGSIPFALVVGKLFYKTDVRKHGSGNLGGSNTGRVLGKKAGVAVIILDALKAFVVMVVSSLVLNAIGANENIKYICAFACILGHCYPIFAGFKGGKAVSSGIGFFLAINFVGAILSLVVFFIVLKLTKYVSLASVLATSAVFVCIPLLGLPLYGSISTGAIILLIIYRHRGNLVRIKNKTENKITWM